MLTIEEFIGQIEEQFEDLERGKLKPDSKFRDAFEWNSINALIIIAMISTEFEVSIDADDIRNSETINDIFNIIKKRIE